MSNASKAPRSRATNEAVEVGKTVFYALLIALVLRVLLFQPFTIPSASMEPTLIEGDYIIVSKYSYGFSSTRSRSARRSSRAACCSIRRSGATSSCSSCRGTTRPTTSNA